MATYTCPSGHVVLLDDDVVLPGRLSIGSHGYAQCFANGRVQLLHRWLMGLDGGGFTRLVDHINRDKLDNRRENLRIVTPAESNLNRSVMDTARNVVQTPEGRWQASLRRNRQTHYLGAFDTEAEARHAVATWRAEHDRTSAA